jgi:hypothetical protein
MIRAIIIAAGLLAACGADAGQYISMRGRPQESASWVAPTGTVAYWSCNNTLEDSVGGYDGTAYGTTAFTNGADGIANTAHWTDNSTDGVKIGDYAALKIGNFTNNIAFTWSVWINTPETTQRAIIGAWYAPWGTTAATEYRAGIAANRYPDFAFGQGAAYRVGTADTAFAANTWTHIAWVHDGTSGTGVVGGMKCYIDGIVVGFSQSASSGTYTASGNAGAGLLLGAFSGASATLDLRGALDAVRFYRRGLSSNEVYTLSREFD